MLVYLDTDELGAAKRIYDRLGFKKVDEVSDTFSNLDKCATFPFFQLADFEPG